MRRYNRALRHGEVKSGNEERRQGNGDRGMAGEIPLSPFPSLKFGDVPKSPFAGRNPHPTVARAVSDSPGCGEVRRDIFGLDQAGLTADCADFADKGSG